MSLWLIKTVSPILDYDPCPEILGQWDIYNPSFCTPPRLYQESISSLAHFFYEPSNDHLVVYAQFSQIHWPGWAAWRYEFSAETGAFIQRTEVNITAISYPCHATMGSYNKIYATWNSGYTIDEVNWEALSKPTGGWSIDPSTWDPSTIFRYAVVNREDLLIAGVGSQDNLQVWDISGTPARRALMRLPDGLGYLTWQSREICWLITQGGLILKANYKLNPPRWEMLSSVQDPSPDATNYFIAWDPKRGRIAVLRQRPDDSDGACRCQFEFYRPLVKVAGLTDPVPVGRHRAGDQVQFVAHLHGDAGEGLTPYKIHASLAVPAQGTLLTPEATTGLNGAASILYQAPEAAGEDTMTIETAIEDGAA